MILKHEAAAGTFESSDAHITVGPLAQGIEIDLQSTVYQQYAKQITETIRGVLKRLEISDAKVVVVDKGALDCTIKSRLETALFRAVDQTEDLPWGTKL